MFMTECSVGQSDEGNGLAWATSMASPWQVSCPSPALVISTVAPHAAHRDPGAFRVFVGHFRELIAPLGGELRDRNAHQHAIGRLADRHAGSSPQNLGQHAVMPGIEMLNEYDG